MKNKKPLITVIVPCYNAEKTIECTVRSVLSQTYQNFELILVDDFSTDNTLLKIKEIAGTDPRIVVISNSENLGQGISRNNGIDIAKGEYISFLDADDIFEVDFLSVLYSALVEADADISECPIRYIFDNHNYMSGSPEGIVSGEHCQYRIDIDDGLPYLSPHPVNKLYKRSLFNDTKYKEIIHEDTEILVDLLKACNRFVVISTTHYNYNKRWSGITGQGKKELPRIEYHLSSIIESVKPYFSDEFLNLINKYGSKHPRCSYANLNNLLRTIVSNKKCYTEKEIKNISEMVNSFTIELFEI
ncbi:glycosyltransferase, partial [Photobacterium japonica]|uniref:glycosyltransferase family 2 protein n=1 Tax=Photobacterium japonica TaxID=2910235 RepID=UPI003D134AD2